MKEDDLPRIFRYIGGVIRGMSGHAFAVGGRPDHIHILTLLPVTIGLADFVRDIKSNTTKWVKNIDPTYKGFAWQEGYGAFSVSKSNTKAVIDYITNQEQHHRTYTAQEEFQQFLIKHGILSSSDD